MRQGKGNSGSVVFDHHLTVWFISLLSTEDSPAVSRHSGWHHFTAFSYYMKSEKSPDFQLNDHQSALRWRNPCFEKIPTPVEGIASYSIHTHRKTLLQNNLFKHCCSLKSLDSVSGRRDAISRHCINLWSLARQLLAKCAKTDLGNWGHREQ